MSVCAEEPISISLEGLKDDLGILSDSSAHDYRSSIYSLDFAHGNIQHLWIIPRSPLSQSRNMILLLILPVLAHAIFVREKMIQISLMSKLASTHTASFHFWRGHYVTAFLFH